MNQYRLCIVDPNLIDLVEKYKNHISKFDQIKNGFIINASSEEEARKVAYKKYSLMILEDPKPSAKPPLTPEINIIGAGAWLNEKLTSCKLVD